MPAPPRDPSRYPVRRSPAPNLEAFVTIYYPALVVGIPLLILAGPFLLFFAVLFFALFMQAVGENLRQLGLID